MIKLIKKIANKFFGNDNNIYSMCENAQGELFEYCKVERFR